MFYDKKKLGLFFYMGCFFKDCSYVIKIPMLMLSEPPAWNREAVPDEALFLFTATEPSLTWS
jgi:hypothetical protein